MVLWRPRGAAARHRTLFALVFCFFTLNFNEEMPGKSGNTPLKGGAPYKVPKLPHTEKNGRIIMEKEAYAKLVKRRAARSPALKNCLAAFAVGGGICALGQCLTALYTVFGLDFRTASTLTTVTLVFIAALLTGIGVFDRIARFAGAGTLVPVTGFANAVVSPAIDNKSEGLILGVGAKIFTVAGPVLLFGTLAGVVYGVVYFIVTRIAALF